MTLNIDGLTLILILLVVVISYRMYKNSDIFQLTCVVSDVDGRKYCVREREKIDAAADRLAEVNQKLVKLVSYCNQNHPDDERSQRLQKKFNPKKLVQLVNYCNQNHPDDERCVRLQKKFNPKKLVETLPTSEYTAYSENKGEKLAFCLDKKKNSTDNLIDINTLTYVAIHELAHICTLSIGHTPEFWENFKFLLVQAKSAGLYNPVDYKNQPGEYCGMPITDNPYYDK